MLLDNGTMVSELRRDKTDFGGRMALGSSGRDCNNA